MALQAGSRLGRYEIVSALGAGGMGEVYLARDTRLDRHVAIKVLAPQFATDADRLRRFEHEARAVAALNNPHICQLHDIGPGYLVLEYIEGRPLCGPMPLDLALRLALQVVNALEAAHQRGILHRDLKPANILVTRDGQAKLLDFGIAKLTSADSDVTMTLDGVVQGTPGYMSPEQAQGRSLDARSDIFSFGAVLYELLSGDRAFTGRSTADVLSAVLRDEPRPLRAPPTVERIVRRCLEKQPAQRFQTAGELREALEAVGRGASEKAGGEQPASIAVLPFANLSADKDNEYFSDGLAEEIINALVRVPQLKVAGRTSSFFFRGKDVEFGEIGKRLSVDHLLEGSVRKAGNRIRVTAQLITADGFHLWSERYDREITDIFAIQDEITDAIVAALRMKLAPRTSTAPRYQPNLRAYEMYLNARALLFRATAESLVRVKELLEQAIELDPRFALAHSLLGAHYTMQANLGLRHARDVIPLARAAEQEALRLDPELPEAHALLAVCDGCDYEWKEAERGWRRAMATQLVSRDVHFWYANHHLLPTGRPNEAVDIEARVLDDDPLNVLYRTLFGVALQHEERLGEAETELQRVLDLEPNFPLALSTLGAVYAQQERFEEALAVTERGHASAPWSNAIIGQLGGLRVRTGDAANAAVLRERIMSGSGIATAAGLALFHAVSGELELAAEWTAHAIDERDPRLVALLAPFLRRSDKWPAFARMMQLPG